MIKISNCINKSILMRNYKISIGGVLYIFQWMLCKNKRFNNLIKKLKTNENISEKHWLKI